MAKLHEEERSFDPPRSLEERLTEYRDAMIETRKGMQLLAHTLEGRGQNADPIRDGVNLYKHIIDDITKLLDGEELKPFEIEVVV